MHPMACERPAEKKELWYKLQGIVQNGQDRPRIHQLTYIIRTRSLIAILIVMKTAFGQKKNV